MKISYLSLGIFLYIFSLGFFPIYTHTHPSSFLNTNGEGPLQGACEDF